MCKVTSLALTLASVQQEIPKKIRLIQNLIVILLLVYLTFSLSSTVKSPLHKPFRRGRHYVRPPKQSFQNTIHSWKRPASISYRHRMSMFRIFSFTTCFLVEFISNGKEINAPLSKLILLASFGNILYPSPSPPPPTGRWSIAAYFQSFRYIKEMSLKFHKTFLHCMLRLGEYLGPRETKFPVSCGAGHYWSPEFGQSKRSLPRLG